MTFPPVPGADWYLNSLRLQDTTGLGGFTLQDATPNIIAWTAPDDGNMHRAALFTTLIVTEAMTGGLIECSFTDPAGTARDRSVYPSEATAGYYTQGGDTPQLWNVAPGSVCILNQGSALTAGAAVLWAEIWGS